ncbi:H-NS family nucleoid-associated regulatory protein [Burkholderia sp. PU8-34]
MATLEAIQTKIAKLQKQAEAMVQTQSVTGLTKIRELMEKHGLTVADIEGFVSRKRGRKSGGAAGVVGQKAKRPVQAKYQDPKSGATWSGRGRAPAWIKDVKDRSKFVIGGAAAADAATAEGGIKTQSAKRGTAKKVATKTTKSSAPAKKAATKRASTAAKTTTRGAAKASRKVAMKKVASRKSSAGRKTAAKVDAIATPEVQNSPSQ